jgi:hypothetical protein
MSMSIDNLDRQTVDQAPDRRILKRHDRALFVLWSAEVNSAFSGGTGLVQSKAKVYRELSEMGLAALQTIRVADRFGPMTITGYGLTHAGRFAACANCEVEVE